MSENHPPPTEIWTAETMPTTGVGYTASYVAAFKVVGGFVAGFVVTVVAYVGVVLFFIAVSLLRDRFVSSEVVYATFVGAAAMIAIGIYRLGRGSTALACGLVCSAIAGLAVDFWLQAH